MAFQEDSILQKSVIPNLLQETFNPTSFSQIEREEESPHQGDVTSKEELQADLTATQKQNMENEWDEITDYKRKQFKLGVDFRKTLGMLSFLQISN